MASPHEFFLDQEYLRTPLGDQIDKASMKMLKQVYLTSDDSNVVTSSLGVMLLLSLYSSGTEGKSREEIMTLLGTSDYKYLFDSYSGIGDKLASMDPSYQTLANKVYVAKGNTPTEEFSNTTRSYHSEVNSIDFSDPKAAAAIINQWATDMTKGHIKDPVTEEMLDIGAVVALFNIIFFQGHWRLPFRAEETREKDFYVNKSLTVKKQMMHLKGSLSYYEDNDLGARMIELLYQETGFRMIVILPNEIEGLASVLEKVEKKGLLEDVFALRPAEEKVNLYMPKFNVMSKLDYKAILPKLGVKGIFEDGAPGIVRERSVVVSKFFQQAMVEVDEGGATAGAFTGAIAVTKSLLLNQPKSLNFIVDHPFLFAILHEDLVLFAGTYTQ